MISLFDFFFALRVRRPRAGLPHGVLGLPPGPVLPSPPPCGWSTGFMVDPRTVGRLPSQRERPALPPDSFSCSRLPTCPMVAEHSTLTRRSSPEGIRTAAYPPSLASSWAAVPAERTSCPPRPSVSSML